MDIKEIKEIAKKFTPEQIEECISQQVKTGRNICVGNKASETILNELSEASFIRDMVKSGMSLSEALRELAKRIRQVQQRNEE